MPPLDKMKKNKNTAPLIFDGEHTNVSSIKI